MRIASLEVFRYRIPLVSPMNLTGQFLHFREGSVIRLTDVEGYYGLAEISPLPGWHQETLDDAFQQIVEKIPYNLKKLVWVDEENPRQSILNLDLTELSYPSVQWGLELALLQLNAHRNGYHLYETLSPSYQNIIQINTLLTGEIDTILQDANNRVQEGFRTLKIKVGRNSVDKEIQLIHNLREVVGSEINIRLDANQSRTITDAVHFGKSVRSAGIEYIEEPLKNSAHQKTFYEETGISVALDESLYLGDPDDLEISPGTQYLILKPSRLGGINQFFNWTKTAHERQIKVVISSTFESGLTMAVLTQLSGIIQPGSLAMGLDTLRWFEQDLPEKSFSIRQGKIRVSDVVALSRELNWDKLALIKKFEL